MRNLVLVGFLVVMIFAVPGFSQRAAIITSYPQQPVYAPQPAPQPVETFQQLPPETFPEEVQAQSQQAQPVQQSPVPINEQLNVERVAELARSARNVQEFERRLNDPNTGVNQLDLNNDGVVDFLRVEERYDRSGRWVRIYDVSVQPEILVQSINVPNPVRGYVTPRFTDYYGVVYSPCYGINDGPFFWGLFRPHAVYVSSFRFGNYGYGYGVNYFPYLVPYAYGPRIVRRVVVRPVVRYSAPRVVVSRPGPRYDGRRDQFVGRNDNRVIAGNYGRQAPVIRQQAPVPNRGRNLSAPQNSPRANTQDRQVVGRNQNQGGSYRQSAPAGSGGPDPRAGRQTQNVRQAQGASRPAAANSRASAGSPRRALGR